MRITVITLFSLIYICAFGQLRSPEEVAQEIFSSSPRFKSLKAETEAVSAAISTSSNLPDPEVEGEFLAAPKGEQNRWGAGISWSLDWPGVYEARKQLSKEETNLAAAGIKVEQRNIGIEIRRLLLDYILQQKQLDLMDSLLLSTDSITKLAEKAHRGGEMTLLDVNKIRLETASLAARSSAIRDEKEKTVSALSVIAGKDCSQLLNKMQTEFPKENTLSEEEVVSLIKNAPQTVEAEMAVKRANQEKTVAKREGMPSISFGYRHAFEDGNHFNGGSLGLSLPIFSSRGKRKAAEASKKAAEISAEEVRLNSENSALSALRRRNALNKEISEVAPLLETADNHALLLKAYSNGVITLIEYLNERNYFLEATLQLLELRHSAANSDLDILSQF